MRPSLHSPNGIREQRLLGFAQDAAAQVPEDLPVPKPELAPAAPDALKDNVDVKEQAAGDIKKANNDIQKIGSVLDNATTTATLVGAKVVSEDGTVLAAKEQILEAGAVQKLQESNESLEENFERTKKDQLLIRENEKYNEASNEWQSLDHGKMDYQKNAQPFQYRQFLGKDAEGKPIPQLLAYSPTGGLQVMDNGKGNWRFVSKMNPAEAAQYKDVAADISARYADLTAKAAEEDSSNYGVRAEKNAYNKDMEDICLKNRKADTTWFEKNQSANFWKNGSGNEHIRDALARALENAVKNTDTPVEPAAPATATETPMVQPIIESLEQIDEQSDIPMTSEEIDKARTAMDELMKRNTIPEANVQDENKLHEIAEKEQVKEKKEPQKQNVETAKAPETTTKLEAEKAEPVKEKQRSPEQEKNELTISALNNIARNLDSVMGKRRLVQPDEPRDIDTAAKSVIEKLGVARNAANIPVYLEGENIYVKQSMGFDVLNPDGLIMNNFIGRMKADPVAALKELGDLGMTSDECSEADKAFIKNLVAPILANFPDKAEKKKQ